MINAPKIVFYTAIISMGFAGAEKVRERVNSAVRDERVIMAMFVLGNGIAIWLSMPGVNV